LLVVEVVAEVGLHHLRVAEEVEVEVLRPVGEVVARRQVLEGDQQVVDRVALVDRS
jgi:hypothetical protein